jgi:hypothetical protein
MLPHQDSEKTISWDFNFYLYFARSYFLLFLSCYDQESFCSHEWNFSPMLLICILLPLVDSLLERRHNIAYLIFAWQMAGD